MKYRLVLAGLGITGALSTTALASEESGVDLGLRLGYGIPLGSVADTGTGGGSVKLSDTVTGQVPIWIDLGYRFTPNIMAGLYFQYGFAFWPDRNCQSPASCSASDIRFGIQGQYRFMPRESVDPWLGIGFGYEWLDLSGSYTVPILGTVDASASVHGWEFLNLQGGVDFKVAEGFGIGPFLSFSLGEYSSASASGTGPAVLPISGSTSGDIQNEALHEWLTLGLRGVFDP